MNIYEGIADAANAVRRFYFRNEADLPQIMQDKIDPLVDTGVSPVDLCVNFARSVYANNADVPNEARQIAAGIADICDQLGFHQKIDGKAAGMRSALLRDSGEPGNWPAKDQDPAIDADFAPAPEPDEAPAPPPPPPPSPAPPAGE